MNSYTFHINLYDLAALGTIFVGLTFSLLLWFTKSINRTANRFLALALVTMILWMLRTLAFDIRLESYLPGWDWIPMQFLLAMGPLIYFYVLKITRPEYKFGWNDFLHFSPLLLEQGALGLEIKESIGTGAATYATQAFQLLNPVLELLIFISIISYLYKSNQLIQKFYRRLQPVLMDRSLLEFCWLRRLLSATALLWLVWIVYAAVDYFNHPNQSGVHLYYPFYIFFAVIIIWTAMAAFLRPQAGMMMQRPQLLKSSVPSELRHKGVWLKKEMEMNLYYQDPKLSLASLAEKCGLTTHELSHIINTAFKKSFNDFINEYRVAEVIKRMQDDVYDRLTLMGIAYDSGFNSKDTFIRAFKRLTGKTPAVYKRDLEKEVATYHLRPQPQTRQIILVPEVPVWSYERLNHNYMFRNYIKVAFRNFWRHKLFTLINVIGLSIGMSAALVIYLIVHYDFTFDKFHKDSNRIYRVVTNFTFQGQPSYNGGVSGPIPGAVKSQVTGVEESEPLFIMYTTDVTIPASKVQAKFKGQDDIIVTGQGYFNLFPYKWLAGSEKTALNEPNKVVLTSVQAQKYFPGLSYDQMLGKTVVYDTIRTTVTGIVQTIKENTDFRFTDFISFNTTNTNKDLRTRLSLNNWGGTSQERLLFVRLAPGTAPANIERQINQILKKNESPQRDPKEFTHTFHLQPLGEIHFDARYGALNGRVADKVTLYELSAIAMFILLLGCINFINLSTAQGAQRSKEIGIRKTMGSSRKQLIAQFLSETFLITLIAVIISVASAPVILKLFSGFIPEGVTADIFGQPAVLLFLAGVICVVSLLSGFYPALVLSGYNPVVVLKGQLQSSDNRTRSSVLRKSLIVTQFVIAQFFIMATALVSKQIYYAVHKDLGVRKDAILIVNTPWKVRTASLNRVFIAKLTAIPQIDMVSAGRDAPTSDDGHSTQATYRDGKKEVKIEIGLKFGDENYIKVYHIKLLAGRNLESGDSTKAFLVNNTYAKMIGFNDPHDAVGKQIDDFNGDTRMKIIGVVADFHQESLHAPIAPIAIITSTNINFNSTFHIALKPQSSNGTEWSRAISSIKEAYKQIYPNDNIDYHFFDETIARLYEQDQRTSTLLSWAMGLSVFISCIGLLGLAMYTTGLRRKEIGVRKVLGASVSQIVTLLSAELVLLVVLAFLIVTPLAYLAINKWMQNFADRTSISWWVFVLSGGGMLLTAFLTLSFQTIKAAIANPVKSLRNE